VNSELLQFAMNQLCRSVVICGPSGVGKGTIINKLLHAYPSKFGLSISHTSRKPRIGETDGQHYHFLSREELENDIQNGPIKFLEFAQVHANLYGTRKDAVERVHSDGKICVLDLDTKGVQQFKSSNFPAKYIFITAPSIEILESRLRSRGTENEESVLLRINNAKKEMQYGVEPGQFDTVLVNESIEETYKNVLSCLKVWFPFMDL
jgi:guanylate kinase